MKAHHLNPFQVLSNGNDAERDEAARWIASAFERELSGPSGHTLYLAICTAVQETNGYVEEVHRHLLPLVSNHDALEKALVKQLRLRIDSATKR